jgi:hypothetical protein
MSTATLSNAPTLPSSSLSFFAIRRSPKLEAPAIFLSNNDATPFLNNGDPLNEYDSDNNNNNDKTQNTRENIEFQTFQSFLDAASYLFPSQSLRSEESSRTGTLGDAQNADSAEAISRTAKRPRTSIDDNGDDSGIALNTTKDVTNIQGAATRQKRKRPGSSDPTPWTNEETAKAATTTTTTDRTTTGGGGSTRTRNQEAASSKNNTEKTTNRSSISRAVALGAFTKAKPRAKTDDDPRRKSSKPRGSAAAAATSQNDNHNPPPARSGTATVTATTPPPGKIIKGYLDRFDIELERLKKFKEEFGDTDVPWKKTVYPAGDNKVIDHRRGKESIWSGLGRWVSFMRKQLQIHDIRADASLLTKDQVQKLKSVSTFA